MKEEAKRDEEVEIFGLCKDKSSAQKVEDYFKNYQKYCKNYEYPPNIYDKIMFLHYKNDTKDKSIVKEICNEINYELGLKDNLILTGEVAPSEKSLCAILRIYKRKK